MSLLDEIETEAWHILISIYTYQRVVEGLADCPTRYELANNLVALNALAEMIVIRTARLADKRKDVRSVSMLLKRLNFLDKTKDVKLSADSFLSLAAPVVKIRHAQIAHMKPGILSSYPLEPLPNVVIKAVEALVHFIDTARDKEVPYKYKVGSQESAVDLRASLQKGTKVTV
ncbi:MAG: hypothetical protein WCJ02_09615 [bacterium]